ncbi:MAG: hypothetical protein FJY65_08255 [Calditrichaeota bacterium]|nr:hypothetical protein [Calditrichota bacterium]
MKIQQVTTAVVLIAVICGPAGAEDAVDFSKIPRAVMEVGMSRSFHLQDGNIVTGTVVELVGDSLALIESVDGKLSIPMDHILPEMIDLRKQDGTRFTGPVLSEDDYAISIKTPYGVVVVLKRDIVNMDRYFGDRKVAWQEEKKRFHSAEELTDIFLDPTAFPLQPWTFYMSGLSLGYGFTENFMLRTQFGHNFTGDMNLHPLFRFYHRQKGTSDLSMALGLQMFNHHPLKREAVRYSYWLVNPRGGRLSESDYTDVENLLLKPDEKVFFCKAYLVLSNRQSLPSGRGKWGWHLGAMTNSLALSKPELAPNCGYAWDDKFEIPYRIWAAMDYDLSKRLKFMIEVFADNGHKFITLEKTAQSYFDFDGTPFSIDTQKGDYQPVDLDFGFLWSISEAFRLGLHFQSSYLTFYWKW